MYTRHFILSGVVIVVTLILCVNAKDDKKTKESTKFLCYTCMGKRYDNCKSATVTCDNLCYTVRDTKHELVVKGCESAASQYVRHKKLSDGIVEENRKFDEMVYEAGKQTSIAGDTTYCKGDRCNFSDVIRPVFVMVFAVAFLVFLS